jgi:YegS/Rv2252/BmrU family lipid kinase
LKKYSFIVNPHARHGKGGRLLERLAREVKARRLNAEIVTTEHPGHATELAHTTNADIIVAVGGDGTINEVANGMIGTSKILGIVPNGSGNDLIKSVGIAAGDMPQALDCILNNKVQAIDCATVSCSPDSSQGNSPKRYFVNGVGIGFDAAVAERTRQIKFLGGTALYMLAVFQTLGKYSAPTFTIEIDAIRTESRNLLIAIGNGRCAGGGFYLTPKAKVDDGMLDVCMIENISVPNILRIMPKVMHGKHETSKHVAMQRGKQITVRASAPFFVHADGEVVGRNVTGVDVCIHEQALQVIVG